MTELTANALDKVPNDTRQISASDPSPALEKHPSSLRILWRNSYGPSLHGEENLSPPPDGFGDKLPLSSSMHSSSTIETPSETTPSKHNHFLLYLTMIPGSLFVLILSLIPYSSPSSGVNGNLLYQSIFNGFLPFIYTFSIEFMFCRWFHAKHRNYRLWGQSIISSTITFSVTYAVAKKFGYPVRLSLIYFFSTCVLCNSVFFYFSMRRARQQGKEGKVFKMKWSIVRLPLNRLAVRRLRPSGLQEREPVAAEFNSGGVSSLEVVDHGNCQIYFPTR